MLLYQAKNLGVKYTNGFPMLVAQAKYAMELFLDKSVSDDVIEPIIKTLSAENQNVILVGMPGSGKTTIGKALAEKLNKEFIDTDQEIERRENRTIPEIFASSGEEYFRKVESQVLKDVGKLAGKIISTGGGVIKNRDNYFPLMQNGKIFWIDRKVESLVTDGRPLSKDLETVKKLYLERKDNYAFFADAVIKNDTAVEDAVKGVIDLL
jgi:shikimate dehydrogenase